MNTSGGIALSGGYIFNAIDANGLDAVENEIDTLDVCLSHPTGGDQFHYHYWTGCAKSGMGLSSKTTAPKLCRHHDYQDCKEASTFTRDETVEGNPALFTPERWH